MIYKILSINQIDVLDETATLKCFSYDGKYSLVSSDLPISCAIAEYPNSEFKYLIKLDLWKQPCFNC